MTCDERLEKLLNKAGQTISDLPKSDGKHLTYTLGARELAEREVFAFAKQDVYMDIIDCLAVHQDYILHLTDVIDRMEWALDTVLNERDYTRAKCCFMCGLIEGESQTCEECGIPKVPEDWRVDDEG